MRVYFATDIHGSEVCWRKFLNAAKFYGADTLIMGGDVPGQAVVPVVAAPGRGLPHPAVHRRPGPHAGRTRPDRGADPGPGCYPYRTTEAELDQVWDDPAAVQRIFLSLMAETLDRWLRPGRGTARGQRGQAVRDVRQRRSA
jgi:hypothetical protein